MTDKDKFLRKFNQAIASNDEEFIQKSITDDIIWVITGQKIVKGKENFMNEIRAMKGEKGFELTIDNLIIHGSTAAVDGTIQTMQNSKKPQNYAFCDIYLLSGFKSSKIKKITSYMVHVPSK